MKIKLTLCLLFYFAVTSLSAQEAADHKTLFKDPDGHGLRLSTFYGEISPATAWAAINNSAGKVFMTELGIQLNRKFTIGYYVARSPKTNVINVPPEGSAEYQEWIEAGVDLSSLPPGATQAYAYFSHTGINLAYLHNSERVLFFRTGIRFGTGKLELAAEQKQLLNIFYIPLYEIELLNLNPEIGIGVNLRPWWRLHADTGYHFVFSGTDVVLDPNKYNGLTFKLGFAFGAFDR
jgi:hypothetical protein